MEHETKISTKKIILCCILVMLLCGALYGCSIFFPALQEAYQNLKTDTSEVEVEITKKYFYKGVYTIIVKYNGDKYTIHGKETYNKYKDRVGETATGILEIKYYDKEAGKKIVRSRIVSLK